MYAKISKKGQVTIPKAIREKLKIENEGAVLFVIENDEVKIKSIPSSEAESLAGSLSEYAKKYVPLKEVRDKIRETIAKDVAKEGIAD